MSAKIDATVSLWPALFVGSNVHVELLGAQTEAGQYVDAAAVDCAITDSSGNAVANLALAYLGRTVTLGFASYTDGNYRGLLSGGVSLVEGETYRFLFTCADPAFSFVHYATAKTRQA